MGWWPGGHRATIVHGRGGGRQDAPVDDGFGTGTYPTDSFIVADHDTIPNLAKNATILSIRTGNWSSTSTWDLGRVPQAGDIVGIKSTHTVTYDVSSTAAIVAVGVAGALVFRTNIATKLTVQHLFVYGPQVLGSGNFASLTIGTSGAPVGSTVTAEIVISDVTINHGTVGVAQTAGVSDPAEYGNGVLCWGNCTMHGTVKTETWLRLTAAPTAGNT